MDKIMADKWKLDLTKAVSKFINGASNNSEAMRAPTLTKPCLFCPK